MWVGFRLGSAYGNCHPNRISNLVFLNGYGDQLSEQIYQLGDLFLMPSSYEPCGISQMLAMRAGQPCVAHAIGGLMDTITDSKNGFTFKGDNLIEQGKQLLQTVDKAITLFEKSPKRWQAISKAATNSRFEWRTIAQQYSEDLYQIETPAKSSRAPVKLTAIDNPKRRYK